MKSYRFVYLVGIVLIAFCSHAQTPVPAPSRIEKLLLSADSFDKTDIENLLGLTCHNYQSVQQHSEVLSVGRNTVIIEIDGCEEKNLVLLEEKHGRWFYESRVPISLHYDQRPMITFKALVKKGENEVIVGHHMVDWGTGLHQMNMTVLKLLGDRLEVVFDEPENLHVAGPGVGNKVIDQEQSSQFTFHSNADSDAPGLFSIMEVETIKSRISRRSSEIKPNTETVTRWWSFVWQPDIRRFRRFPNFGF